MRFSFSIERLIGETHSENRFHLNILSNMYICLYMYTYAHYIHLFGIHTIYNVMRIVKHTRRIFWYHQVYALLRLLGMCTMYIHRYYPKRRYMFTVQ